MTFTIPNKALVYPMQSRIFQSDIDMLQAAAGGRYGVLATGCEVTETTPIPGANVQVAAGYVVIDGTLVTVAQQTVGLDDADPLLPRFDLVVANADGTCTAIGGVADDAPFPESPSATQAGLAQVFVPTADLAIEQEQIVDKRIYVPSPIAPGVWTRLSCTTDLARSNNALPSADPVLSFPMSATATYRVRGFIAVALRFSTLGSPGGIGYSFTGPASPASVVGVKMSGIGTGSVGQQQPPVGVFTYGGFPGFTGYVLNGGTGAQYYGNLTFEMVIHNGPNTGTWAFNWAQSSANATPDTRLAGSYLEYEVV